MFRFWYRFIPANMSSIATGLSDVVYKKAITPQLPNYMGLVFEQICTQYLVRENAKLSLPFVFGRIGRWRSNNPVKKKQDVLSRRHRFLIEIIQYKRDRMRKMLQGIL